MLKRLEGQDLFSKSKTQFQEDQREAEAAIRALEILEGITDSLLRAGWGGKLNHLEKMTVADLALMAARNDIELTSSYYGSKPQTTRFSGLTGYDFSGELGHSSPCGEVELNDRS